MEKFSLSMSTNLILPPALVTATEVAKNVLLGIITSLLVDFLKAHMQLLLLHKIRYADSLN
jgi:hypothetical protein